MPAETCERCHRPKAATYEAWIADRQTCFRHSQYALSYECEAVRDAWQVAEIARLTAALAEATKPRWVRNPHTGNAQCWHLMVGKFVVGVTHSTCGGGIAWRVDGLLIRDADGELTMPNGIESSVSRAKSAAEKACGVEGKDA